MNTKPADLRRRYDLDWLRVLAILAIFFYHSFRFFNLEIWHIKNSTTYPSIETLTNFVDIWMMPFVFLITPLITLFRIPDSASGTQIRAAVGVMSLLMLIVPIVIPPLRDRRDDIPLLVDRFVAELAQLDGLPRKRFQADAIETLRSRDWPGNVRELRNAVERLLILTGGGPVTATDVRRVVPEAPESPLGDLGSCQTFESFKLEAEKAFLVSKLAENDWNVSETARKLEMPRSNLYKKIEKYGLTRNGES